MKSIYVIFDKVAQESATPFFANNDEHAKKILLNQLQKQPQDIEFSVYKVLTFEDGNFKENSIFEYPFKAENSVKMTNENIDKIMEE